MSHRVKRQRTSNGEVATSKMRAARFYGKEDLRIEEIDEPKCGDDDVKIAPAFVGICGTDLHEYIGGPNFAPTSPHPLTGEEIPITFGHEFSGVVTEVGKNVEDMKVGANVIVQPTISCWECGACTVGAENACPKGGFIGLSGAGGGLADFVTAPRYKVFELPDNVPLDVGALAEPLAVGWHAVSSSPLKKGERALVLGGGPIGIAILQALKAYGAGVTICAEVAPARQRFAKQFGADYILDPSKEDVVQRAYDICSKVEGLPVTGPDVVFDCAGVPASIKTACAAVRSRGTIVNVAIWERDVPFNPTTLVLKEAKFIAVLGYQKKDYEYVVEALGKGSMAPKEMITKVIKLEDLVEEGFMTLIKDKDNHVKVLVDLKM